MYPPPPPFNDMLRRNVSLSWQVWTTEGFEWGGTVYISFSSNIIIHSNENWEICSAELFQI